MKYFLDTEFIEDGKTIELLSIGIVAEDGREFYAVNVDADLSKANDWVKANVLPHLLAQVKCRNHYPLNIQCRATRAVIRELVLQFCFHPTDKPEFWGYYCDYDWVVFCQLFGTMMDLPKGFPMYCRDMKQLCDSVGNPELEKQESVEHNALADARWIAQQHSVLETLQREYNFRA